MNHIDELVQQEKYLFLRVAPVDWRFAPKIAPFTPITPFAAKAKIEAVVVVLNKINDRIKYFQRRRRIVPDCSTSTSLAPLGTGLVVVVPPGHRTHNWVAPSAPPNTSTALSSDQYPLPA